MSIKFIIGKIVALMVMIAAFRGLKIALDASNLDAIAFLIVAIIGLILILATPPDKRGN